MKLNNKVYDILKYATLIGIPAVLTFYGMVGTTLSIPHTQEVLTIGAGFVTMLGSMLGVSNANYKKENK